MMKHPRSVVRIMFSALRSAGRVWRASGAWTTSVGWLAVVAVCGGCTSPAAPPITAVPSAQSPAQPAPARDVVLVGNNWVGTVVAFDPEPPFRRLATFNVVPDRELLTRDIERSARRGLEMALIRKVAGEGHDQLVDDVFTSPDGRYLYASRPSYKDVVAIDLVNPSNPMPHWRTPVSGSRADHAALSPDGSRLLVSASTAKKVHEIETATGRILRSFPSGDEPHESSYSHDGSRIFHASIGAVFLPTTSALGDRLKGERVFQIVDTQTFKVLDRFDMREKTKEFGQEWKDSAVRPMVLTPDDKFVFFQMSFLHGFYEFDVDNKRITRRMTFQDAPELETLALDKFQLNSADHGITISGDGTKLCVAGTMTGKAYIVRRDTFAVTTIDVGPKPYWSTTSVDGSNCYVSVSERNQVVVISFKDEKEIGRVDVGPEPGATVVVHPQRVRNGRILVSALNTQ